MQHLHHSPTLKWTVMSFIAKRQKRNKGLQVWKKCWYSKEQKGSLEWLLDRRGIKVPMKSSHNYLQQSYWVLRTDTNAKQALFLSIYYEVRIGKCQDFFLHHTGWFPITSNARINPLTLMQTGSCLWNITTYIDLYLSCSSPSAWIYNIGK